MTTMFTIAIFLSAFIPLIWAGRTKKHRKTALLLNLAAFITACLIIMGGLAVTAYAAAEPISGQPEDNVKGLSMGSGLGLLAAAFATGCSCIGAGVATASAASAAIGAISENSKVFGRALIFVALSEGVALYGMLISTQILAKI